MSNLDILNSKNQSFFLPIGGIGEIGGNNYLYSFKGEQIIVDAGISFADDSLPGVDITIPDPYIFLNPSIKPKAMILTHAHEDHVGGLEYYFDKIDFPIYCNQFTYAYIKHKFKRIPDFEKKFHIIKSYQEISFKNFSFQLIPTTHSIPDPTGVFFKTNDGNIYHTGDWKIDKNPVTGDPFDYDNFKILKDENIDLLIGDSTNAGVKEISRSESELDPSFDRLFENLNGIKNITLVVVAHRLSTIKNFDEILFFESGKLTERGSHKNLMAKKGSYYQLYQKQLKKNA